MCFGVHCTTNLLILITGKILEVNYYKQQVIFVNILVLHLIFTFQFFYGKNLLRLVNLLLETNQFE